MKRILLFLFVAVTSAMAMAEVITPEQALEQAQSFISKREADGTRPRRAPGTAASRLTMTGQISGLYVFNVAADGGFVIVSNDDSTRPILGYSDSGNIDINNIPQNMRAWLQGYADEIAWAQKQPAQSVQVKNKAPRRIGNHSTVAIAPLVTTHWSQDTPYNNLCPEYSSGNKAATGCVATAMAQVMNFHKWPQTATTTIPGYTSESYNISLDELPATTFDWANMADSYSGSYTTDQANAVATLMQYCGWSVAMDYGPESGATTSAVADALIAYFDYNSNTTQCVIRSFYTYAKWTDLIYHELSQNRPVVYGGMSSGGGHEFVCDGYKFESNTDFFHINWGWAGMSDNYFVLSALDPDQQGIGGSTSDDGFHFGQDAVIGIQPSTGTGAIANITPNVIDLTLNSMTASRNPAYVNLPVNIILNITNNSADDYDGDIFLGNQYNYQGTTQYELLDGSNYAIAAGETKDIVIPFTPYAEGTFNLVFFLPNAYGSYSTNGEVQLVLTATQPTTDEYVPIYGYYCDELSRSQFIIPASNLEDMAYGTLNGVTFYATNDAVSWDTAEFDVYLSEVNETTISELKDWSSLEKVYAGSLAISDGKMEITFDTPYLYKGGNLLVGINQTVTGDYAKSNWIGTTVNGVSLGGYNADISQRNFLPNTTFDYTPGAAPAVARPTNITVNYTGGTTAEVSWTSTESAWDIDVNGVVTENVTNPYTLTNLEFATTYTIKVRAKNGSDVSYWSAAATFTTDLSDDICQIKLELTDYYGDGWNGAAIQVVDVLSGVVIGTFTNENLNGTSGKGTNELNTHIASVPNKRDINFVWVSGSYDDECSFIIYDVNGEIIYQFEKDDNGPTAGVLATYHVDCTITPWRKPSDVAASNIGTHSALLSWTENSNPAATAWVVAIMADGDTDFAEVNVTENPFTLTSLAAETEYTVKVRPVTDDSSIKWSDEITFTTDIACPVPTSLAVIPTPTSATISWNGDAEKYDLRYKTARRFRYGFETAEPWAVDNFAPCTTYDGDGIGTYHFSSWAFTNQGYTGACIAFQNDNAGSASLYSHSGNACGVMFNPSNGSAANDWFILPEITIQDGYEFSFWAREITDDYGAEVINVGIYGDTDGTFAATLAENLNINTETWTEQKFDLSAYAGQTIRLAINCVSTDIFGFMFDDIYVGNLNDDSGWTTVADVTSPYTLNGLVEETLYDVQVRGYYGAEGYSAWATAEFATPSPCEAPNTLDVAALTHEAATLTWTGYQDSYNVQYRTAGGSKVHAIDDFENGNQGWTQNGDGIFSGLPYSGTYMLVMGYNTTGTTQYIITPELSDFESGTTVQFYQRYFQSATTFKVGFSSTTADIDAFTWGSEQDATSSYTLYSEEIPVGTRYIAIQHTSTAQANALFIDYCGIYGPYVTPGAWVNASTNDPTLDITGLSADTKYEWQVQGNCSSGTTAWSESAYFTTNAEVTLANVGDNTNVISTNDGKICDVTLANRTLYKDGKWNTICLPFDVTLADSPLAGATARTVTAASINGTTLNMTFGDAVDVLQAGTPYIIKWATGSDIVNPVFEGVQMSTAYNSYDNGQTGDAFVGFIGTYQSIVLTGALLTEYANRALLLTGNNQLRYAVEGVGLGAQRAFFLLGENASSVKQVTSFSIDFGDDVTTGIISVDDDTQSGNGLWYSVDGRAYTQKPTTKGIYINNGKKLIIK